MKYIDKDVDCDINFVDRLKKSFGFIPKNQHQLIELLADLVRENILDEDTLLMFEGLLSLADMRVREIMTLRADMVTLVETQTIEDMIQIIMGAGFSRFPVFNENQDKVVGILMVKDLFVCYKSDHCLLSDVIRPAVFVPESKQLSELLKSFRRDRYHMALVVDEYGMLSGLITIEDILEQIVGDIEDEFFASPKDASIKKLENNKFMIKAATTIIDFNKYFDTNIDSHEYQTVGGLILQELGHMPRRGEQAVIKNFRFTVSRSDSKKIRLIEVENV